MTTSHRTPPEDVPPIRTQSDLEATWRMLMEPLGFAGPSLWMLLVRADGTPSPQLVEISGADHPPSPDELTGLVRVLGAALDDEPGGRWAFLRTRPGRGGADDRDRAWARAVLGACARAGVPTDVVHLATDDRLVPLPFDDLAVPA